LGFLEIISKLLRYFGLLSFIVAFIGILISILLNPWFEITKNALSDLGRIGRSNSYIFNSTLIISSLFAIAYSIHLSKIAPGKLGCIGVGVYLVSSFSLMLIGLFPEGTYPHRYVSLEFFVLMTFSILLFGISFLRNGRRREGLYLITLFLVSAIGSFFISWPSVASLEIFNILCYFAAFIIILLSEKNERASIIQP